MKQVEEYTETISSFGDTTRPITPEDRVLPLPEESDPPEVREARALARRYRLPYVDLLPPEGESPINYQLLAEIPVDLMLRHQFVPLRREGKRLHVAMADPTDLERLDEIASALHARLVPHVSTAGAIDVVLRKGDATQRVLQEATSGFRISLVKETEAGEEVLDLDRLATDSEMSPIIKLVDTIIFNAMESRSSDIHIETRDTEVQVKYRIDGALYAKVDPIDIAFHQTLISRIKVMSELDIAERRVPQDGRFRVRYKGRTVDFRVSIMPTVHGEDAVIRILDKEQINEEFRNLDLDVVGFGEENLRKFRRYIAEPYGMVLVTGPTGSGKSTTLAAMIDKINNDRHEHILTIEDPIEFLHNHKNCVVNQREVNADTRGFADALRTALRQDPDVVLVGEMRDLETIESALRIAETGHLTFATLHTNSAFSTINRIIDVFPSEQQAQIRAQLSLVLEGIMCQALLPRADGHGRVMALEILVPNSAIRNLIREDKVHQIYSMMQTGQDKYGMQTFNQALATLYHKRQITLDTAMQRSSNTDELRELIDRGSGLNTGNGTGPAGVNAPRPGAHPSPYAQARPVGVRPGTR